MSRLKSIGSFAAEPPSAIGRRKRETCMSIPDGVTAEESRIRVGQASYGVLYRHAGDE